MNTVVTSREDILKASRRLVQEGTAEGISIRSVAAACGVSVGSIYNYFQSKSYIFPGFFSAFSMGIKCIPDFLDSMPCLFRKKKKKQADRGWKIYGVT